MSTLRLTIEDRVQRVGFRDWMVQEARRLGVDGWVRNGPAGTVEALVHGEAAAVEALLIACRRGPSLACVSTIREQAVAPPQQPGFIRHT